MPDSDFLQIRSVRKTFGGITALDDVSLSIEPGRVHGLIGPNGSGKTTLFNVITGFLRPDRGSVRFRGNELTGLRPEKVAQSGVVRTFQSSLNPQQMTVMENMLLGPVAQVGEGILNTVLRYRQVREQERASEARAWEILELVRLDHQADTYVSELSGGQKKLLSLAQTLMADPQLILLDEPVAGVNPRLIEDILAVIDRLRGDGYNFLVVEHNMRVVRRICDHIHVLDAGTVLADGPPNETLQRQEVLEAYLATQRKATEEEDSS
jgi:ABC-type branched-subunit amino acid transport system ATPase component